MDAVWYCAMRTQAVCLVLLLTLASLVHSTSAEGDDETLEARDAWAEFFPDSEATILQWRNIETCLLYTSPSPRDVEESRMPSSA